MEATLLYWLKANVVLALFVAAYYGLLRRLTFFGLNRAYLLFALGFAAVYPLLPMPALLPAAAGPLPLAAPGGLAGAAAVGVAAAPGFDWWRLAGGLYLVGAAGLLLRLGVQLGSLARVRHRSRPAVALGQAVRVVPGAGGPFSFGATIYLTASALLDTASLPATLRHEQAHARQWHTLDVLLLQLATALAWPNPAAWLLRRLALDNLEYLADRAALQPGGLPKHAYQYLLLRQQAGGVPAPALAFHFSFLTLKNRILMLNQPLSSSRQLGRYLLAAPVVVLLALGYSGARAQTGPQPAPVQKPLPANLVVYVDGKQVSKAELDRVAPADMMSSINVLKPAQAQQLFQVAAPTMLVTTRANANSPEVLAFNQRVSKVVPPPPAEQVTPSYYEQTPAEVNAVVPKALAYITNHYPDARLSGQVMKLANKNTGEVKFRVQLVRGRRPFDVYFSPEGDFLGK